MGNRRLIQKAGTATKASDEMLVISAKQLSDYIYPDRIYLKNSKYIIFQSVAGDNNAYITRDANDNVIIANLIANGDISITVTMGSGNQRTLLLKEYGLTNTIELYHDYEFTIRTGNDNINLLPADDLVIATGGGNVKILNMPTSDPNEAGALWNSSGFVKISAG